MVSREMIAPTVEHSRHLSSHPLIPPSLNLLSSSHPSLSQSSLSPSLNLLTFARAVKRVNFVAPLSPKEREGGREGERERE